MNLEQTKMKTELIEAADIIAEREEALGQELVEDIQEMMFVNSVFSQQAPPQAPATSNEMNFQTMILVPEMNVELTITYDRKLNELVIPNLQQNVQYQSMPPQLPPSFITRNNQLYEDQSPFGATIQIKPKEPAIVGLVFHQGRLRRSPKMLPHNQKSTVVCSLEYSPPGGCASKVTVTPNTTSAQRHAHRGSPPTAWRQPYKTIEYKQVGREQQ